VEAVGVYRKAFALVERPKPAQEPPIVEHVPTVGRIVDRRKAGVTGDVLRLSPESRSHQVAHGLVGASGPAIAKIEVEGRPQSE
jgi:hypothetical protein